ncbi:DNA-binding protein (plasmid) [Raoultella ornithinolytica]|uniref:DNA-binding protein n=1 Tax=Raoultella ornithinolytica TaxID=54291 RepID=UPI0030D38612
MRPSARSPAAAYTTISPALNEWKARQATAAAPLREPAPQAVADRLAELGSDLWTIALDLANARLAVEREGLEKARAELEADRAEAHRMAERLTAAQAERDQATKAAAQAREDAARLAGQLDTLKEQSAALLARITPPAAEVKPTRKKPGSGE